LRGLVTRELRSLLEEFPSIETELQKASWVQLLFGERILSDPIVMQNLGIDDQQVLAHVSWDALLPDKKPSEHVDPIGSPPGCD
jgi:hypothetical protein